MRGAGIDGALFNLELYEVELIIDSSSSDAPMRYYPNGTSSVARVPAEEKLEILETNSKRLLQIL